MTDKQIFEYLFQIAETSNDKGGVVTSCLVRNKNIISSAVSTNDGIHAEYALLQNLREMHEIINSTDIVYTTVEPCGKRTPGKPGEKYGDCTTNLIEAGVKSIVYAAADPDASKKTRYKFQAAGVELIQVKDEEIIKEAVDIFNASAVDSNKHLPSEV